MALASVGAAGGACLCGLAAWPRCKGKAKNALLTSICKVLAKALAGCQVSMSNLKISTSRGVLTVEVHDLTIGNVEGFKAEFLAKIEDLSFAIDLSKAVKSAIGSCGKPSEIEILLVKASECHFIHEKDSLTGSNFRELLNKLGKEEEAEEKREQAEEEQERKSALEVLSSAAAAAHGAVKSTAAATQSAAKTAQSSGLKALIPWHKKEEPEPGGMQVLLRKVDITGISIELATSSQKERGTAGHNMKIADIKFDDFSTTCGRAKPSKVVRILVMKIMESVILGCANLAAAGHEAFEGLEQATQSTWSYMTSWLPG